MSVRNQRKEENNACGHPLLTAQQDFCLGVGTSEVYKGVYTLLWPFATVLKRARIQVQVHILLRNPTLGPFDMDPWTLLLIFKPSCFRNGQSYPTAHIQALLFEKRAVLSPFI